MLQACFSSNLGVEPLHELCIVRHVTVRISTFLPRSINVMLTFMLITILLALDIAWGYPRQLTTGNK
jgi:hypothetical protein